MRDKKDILQKIIDVNIYDCYGSVGRTLKKYYDNYENITDFDIKKDIKKDYIKALKENQKGYSSEFGFCAEQIIHMHRFNTYFWLIGECDVSVYDLTNPTWESFYKLSEFIDKGF